MSSNKKVGILRFLGTNCDRDVWQAVESVGLTPEWLWYQDKFDPKAYRGLVIPGGFSYGDYLRCGALAAKAPVMSSLSEANKHGVPVLGICNGFQILCDSGLLPGALTRNIGLRFVDDWVEMNLANSCQFFAGDNKGKASSKLPIAHGEGRFFIDENGMKALQDNQQIWWTYENNPNGSLDNIAGIMNKEKNIAGLMPHPERAMHNWMGGEDGRGFFECLV